MKIVARRTDGSWDVWRAGRRRLAFIPKVPAWTVVLAGADDLAGLAGSVLAVAILGVGWLAALLATVIVWPWREFTGEWLVVAYPTAGGTAGQVTERRVNVRGKAQAELLVRQWADEIKTRGSPTSAMTHS